MVLTPPPCIWCGYEHVKDVTAASVLPMERQYECPACQRRFSLEFKIEPLPKPNVR